MAVLASRAVIVPFKRSEDRNRDGGPCRCLAGEYYFHTEEEFFPKVQRGHLNIVEKSEKIRGGDEHARGRAVRKAVKGRSKTSPILHVVVSLDNPDLTPRVKHEKIKNDFSVLSDVEIPTEEKITLLFYADLRHKDRAW